MDFLNSIKQYIEKNADLYVSNLQVGTLLDGNSIAIRPVPSTPPIRYLEKSKIITYQFQVLTKHSHTGIAYNTLEEINSLLDILELGAIKSANGSFVFNKCEVYTSPNFVEKTTKGEMIFTALYQAELYIKKEE